MAWKEKTPEEILGMSQEEFKAKLAKIEQFESKFGEITELITKQNEGITALGESVKSIKVTSPYAEQNRQTDPNNDPNKKPQLRAWDEDADGAFADRTAPLINLTLDTRGAVARRSVQDEMQSKYSDWHLFAQEIDELAKNEPLSAKAQEGFWRNVYYVVKGKHAEEIAQDQINKTGKFYTESANSITVKKEEQKSPEDSLTDEQKKYAAKMGVSLTDYAKYANEQRVQ